MHTKSPRTFAYENENEIRTVVRAYLRHKQDRFGSNTENINRMSQQGLGSTYLHNARRSIRTVPFAIAPQITSRPTTKSMMQTTFSNANFGLNDFDRIEMEMNRANLQIHIVTSS